MSHKFVLGNFVWSDGKLSLLMMASSHYKAWNAKSGNYDRPTADPYAKTDDARLAMTWTTRQAAHQAKRRYGRFYRGSEVIDLEQLRYRTPATAAGNVDKKSTRARASKTLCEVFDDGDK